MNYKIVNFYPEEGKLEVFYSDKLENLIIDVPIKDNGLFIVGEELDAYIQGFIPTWHIERMEQLKAGVPNTNDLVNLVEVLPTKTYTQEELEIQEQTIRNSEMWAQVEFERQIAKALIKFGVLETDPTTIPVN